MRPIVTTAPFIVRDRPRMAEEAQGVGHALLARGPREVAALRGDLAEIADSCADDSYERGFLDAIEHVLAGFTAEATHRRVLDEGAAAVRPRRNATKVLVALHGGCDLPSQVSAATGLKAPTVSTTLAELESEGLVERLAPAGSGDQRTSPRRLTIRGMHVAERLASKSSSPAVEAARSMAPLFIEFYKRLSDESLLPRERFAEIAAARIGGTTAAAIGDMFLEQAAAERVISITDGVVSFTTGVIKKLVSDALREALHVSEPPPLFQRLRDFAGGASVCLRTTTAMRDDWSVALSCHDMLRQVRPWCADDARTEQLPVLDGPYVMLWDMPAMIDDDLADAHLRPIVSGAIRRGCVAPTMVELPAGVDRVSLEAA